MGGYDFPGSSSVSYSNATVELSNPDTNGTEESGCISEVSLFQGVNLHSGTVLGEEEVSLLEKCPHFRDVLREVSPFQGCP